MVDPPIHLAGEPPVTVAVRRAARARRMSLRVSRLDGRITLTLPTWAPRREAEAFVQEKAGWLRARLSEQTDKVQITWGAEVPVEGVFMKVVAGRRTRLVPDEAMIAIASGTRSVPAAVAGVLKSHARDRLTTSSDRYSAALGRHYARITLRDTRSRWGSCSSRGALMYSWRLILAPPDVLDYVAAHEVAHLAQMNHSPAFWAEVAALCPNYAAPRAWLRRHGEDLHRYRFSG